MLTGTVALKDDPSLILDVNGVGYKVFVPQYVLLKEATLGERLQLFIHTHVREDLLELYGFPTREDLMLFEQLINVSGVGCKSALGIFSIGKRGEIVNAIMKGDVAFFMGVPRLGKKNSQKIIIELKNKIAKDSSDLDLTSGVGEEEDEVLQALQQIGFTNREAVKALQSLAGAGENVNEKIKLALKYLGK